MAAYILKQGDIITIAFVRKLAMNRGDAARCRVDSKDLFNSGTGLAIGDPNRV